MGILLEMLSRQFIRSKLKRDGNYVKNLYREWMTGEEYERYVALRIENEWKARRVELTKGSGDFGADIVGIDSGGRSFCVQCKKFSKPVGVKAVQEVIGARIYYRCQLAYVVTNNAFTPAAVELAKRSNVVLLPYIRGTI